MKSTCRIEINLQTGVAIRLPGRLCNYLCEIFEVIVFGVIHLFPILFMCSVVNLNKTEKRILCCQNRLKNGAAVLSFDNIAFLAVI